MSALTATLIGRPGDAITAAITTTVVLLVAAVSPHGAWEQPILRLADTVIGIAVGVASAWLDQRVIRPRIARPAASTFRAASQARICWATTRRVRARRGAGDMGRPHRGRYGSGTIPCAPRGNFARVSPGMFRCAETSLGGRWASQLASETSS